MKLYYDDGYEVRAFRLSNGDVFTIRDLMLEFEDNILYEVREIGSGFFRKYKRTGKSFTPEKINLMFK